MATQNSDNNVLFGTTAGTNAATGDVGEVFTSQILFASANSISNNAVVNLLTINLTAGDWDVFGSAYFAPAASTVATKYIVAINTSIAMPDVSLRGTAQLTFPAAAPCGIDAPWQNINVSSTTATYLMVQTTFSTSTMTVCGIITARRRR